MHWCYVSARNRTRCVARVAVMLAQCSRSAYAASGCGTCAETLARLSWPSLMFAAAKRPKSHLTTGNRSLSSNTTNFSACRFENPYAGVCHFGAKPLLTASLACCSISIAKRKTQRE